MGLRSAKTADNGSDSIDHQQAHITKTLQFDGSSNEVTVETKQADSVGTLKLKRKGPEGDCDFASSRLTRSPLLRGGGKAHTDSFNFRSNQFVFHGPTGSCSDILERQTRLSTSHESTVGMDISDRGLSEDALKCEGSSRLTRRLAKLKQSASVTVTVPPFANEYDYFTDCLADRSHKVKSVRGRDSKDSIADSLSREPRLQAKKTAVLDRRLTTSETKLTSEVVSSFVSSSDMENSSGSILNLDNTISGICDGGEKRTQWDKEQTCKCNPTDESEKTPPKRGRPKAPKRKSLLPAMESHVDGMKNRDEDDIGTEKAPEATMSGSSSNRLLRSYSCPEMATLLHHDQPCRLPTIPPHGRTPLVPTPSRSVLHPPQYLQPPPSKRARRHTVGSLEIEREIAPLCLRKEVYPASTGSLYGKLSLPLCCSTATSSTSYMALVSSFLSSPLAFLSRRSDGGKRKARDNDSASTSSCLSPGNTMPCSISSPPSASNSAVHHSLAGFTCSAPPRDCRSSEDGEDFGQQSDSGEENRCSLNLDLLSREMPKEKALSDSEIKVKTKQGERGKVSSIRIRKTLPKRLYNLTPMGLPRPNNFTMPTVRHLETIFEVPHKQNDGSYSLLGEKQVKRFIVFPKLRQIRKVQKSQISAGTNSTAQKKSRVKSSRKKKGQSSKPQPSPEDDLLRSKLEYLDILMAEDEDMG